MSTTTGKAQKPDLESPVSTEPPSPWDEDNHIISSWITRQIQSIRGDGERAEFAGKALMAKIKDFGTPPLTEIESQLVKEEYAEVLENLKKIAEELRVLNAEITRDVDNRKWFDRTGKSQKLPFFLMRSRSILHDQLNYDQLKNRTDTMISTFDVLLPSVRIMAGLSKKVIDLQRKLRETDRLLDYEKALNTTLPTQSKNEDSEAGPLKYLSQELLLKKTLLENIDIISRKPIVSLRLDLSSPLEEPSSKRYANYRSQRLDGTCKWFIRTKEFEQWLFREGHKPRTLYCWGPPSSGKSTVMSRVIDTLHSTGRIYAFYYLGRGKVQSAEELVISLISQLCCRAQVPVPSSSLHQGREIESPDTNISVESQQFQSITKVATGLVESLQLIQDQTRPSVESPSSLNHPDQVHQTITPSSLDMSSSHSIYNRKAGPSVHQRKSDTSQGSANDSLQLLLSILERVCKSIQSHVFIVFDAWDEPNMDSVGDFYTTMSRLHSFECRVLITARAEPGGHIPYRYVSSSFRHDRISEDLEAFVKHTFKTLKHGFGRRDSGFSEEFINRLTEDVVVKSDGAFNRATTLVRIVMKNLNLHQPLDSSLFELENSSDDLSDIMLADLRLLRDEMIPREGAPTKHSADQCLQILVLLSVAQSALSTEDLNHLLVGTQFRDALDRLNGLVAIDPGNLLAHLISERTRAVITKQWVNLSQSMTSKMANECISSLLRMDWDVWHTTTGFPDNHLRQMLKQTPFIIHAAQSWAVYTRESLEKLDADSNTDQNSRTPKLATGETIALVEELFSGDRIHTATYIAMYLSSEPSSPSLSHAERVEWILSMTRLHLASRLGLMYVVKKELRSHPYLHSEKDSQGRTPLHEAARGGFEDVAKLLLSAGASTYSLDKSNKTPLHYVSQTGNDALFAILFEEFCKAFHEEKVDYATADEFTDHIIRYALWTTKGGPGDHQQLDNTLIKAIEQEKTEVCYFLLKNGHVTADATTDDQIPALHIAIRRGSPELIDMLLDSGANATAVAANETKESALHVAARIGDYRTMRKLVIYGADTRCTDSQDKTALVAAFEMREVNENSIINIARILLRKGLDIDQADDKGCSVLHLAAQRGWFRLLLTILPTTKQVDQKDQKGRTPYEYAIEAGEEDAALLISQFESLYP